jgi:anti-sigma factor RsiW
MSTLNDRDRENLTAYLDGELDRKTAQALEAKINLDPEARQEVEDLKRAWGMLDYLPKPSPPADFTHRTMERLSLEKMGRAIQTGNMARHRAAVWWRAAGWAAAILVAAGVGLGAGQFLFPKSEAVIDSDESLVRHLRVLDKWRQYENVDDIEFVRALDHPDLFGDDQGS